MPPDADKLRQRPIAVSGKTIVNSVNNNDSSLRTLSQLSSTEVCIDGYAYDIKSFVHPGGDQILVMGGNDVTVQYRMIHPYHTDKHLSKMTRVGKVVDYDCEYKFDTPFEREVKKEVFQIVRRGREFATIGWYARAAFYISFFFALQYLWMTTSTSWTLAIVYGVAQAWIGLNVQHDANHGAVSKKAWINDLLGLGADFIGGSKWLWQTQHWTHHTYTNHATKDPDSFGAEPLLLFNNYPLGHPARQWYHRFQTLTYLPALSMYWLSSIFNPQILDLQQRGAQFVGIRMDSEHLAKSRKFAVGLRILYIVCNIIVPLYNQNWRPVVLGHIFVMGIAESLTLAVLFSLSHNFLNSDRDPTGSEKVCWYKSQVETSCTYGGWLSGALTGGLNFQVEHHLFPRMSSAWYPYIAPTVRKVCAKHNVKYAYYPSLVQNLVSTVKYMHAAGTGSNHHFHLDNPLSGNN